MNLYSPHNCCPKCGMQSFGISTKHTELMGGGDVITRVCKRCKFSWREKPLDQRVSLGETE